jgi:pectate lyase
VRLTPDLARPGRPAVPLTVSTLLLGLALLGGPARADAGSCPNAGLPGTPYQGYGASTPGGAGKPIYRVTTRADSGPGSLRDALSRGDRCVVFDVAGEIVLRSQLSIKGGFVTVDGFSAPAPGITLRDYGLMMWGTGGVHDVIVRGLRIRNAGQGTCGGIDDHTAGACWDGIQIKSGATRVVIDHVSIDNASDGAIDIARSSDVTVQWSILSGTGKSSLIEGSTRVSMHHNLFIDAQNRNPQAQWDTSPPATVLDFRNNLVWGYAAYGTVVLGKATANVVQNYYHSAARPEPRQALVAHGRAYASGNESGSGADVDGARSESRPFSASTVTTTDACRAAAEVQDEAGARGAGLAADAVDRAHLKRMPDVLPGCGAATAATSAPTPAPSATASVARPDLVMTTLAMASTLQRGQEFGIDFAIANRGTASAATSRVKIYLSTDRGVSSGDVLLRDRSVSALAPGASQSHGIVEVIPTTVKPGAYYVVFAVDQGALVTESNEGNNVRAVAVTVR